MVQVMPTWPPERKTADTVRSRPWVCQTRSPPPSVRRGQLLQERWEIGVPHPGAYLVDAGAQAGGPQLEGTGRQSSSTRDRSEHFTHSEGLSGRGRALPPSG
jgi:hypothetical protein